MRNGLDQVHCLCNEIRDLFSYKLLLQPHLKATYTQAIIPSTAYKHNNVIVGPLIKLAPNHEDHHPMIRSFNLLFLTDLI